MYTEEVHWSPRLLARFAIAPAVALLALGVVLVVVPLPAVWRLVLGALLVLYLLSVALVVAGLSRTRITIDDRALTVAFRLLVVRRFALEQIAACAPTDMPVQGLAYRRRSLPFRPVSTGGRAVVLQLTDGAQVVFASSVPHAVCATLRARRPDIADAAVARDQGRVGGPAPGSWAAAAEAESRQWIDRCGVCGYEQSVWEMGGVMWKAAGKRHWYETCTHCGKRSWHTVSRRPAGP